ncbi:hypothetical protein PYV02_06715 [Leifsonia sp. H3M29-4]|uniref:hypothetical protein n=1 Tax=Salinibacterium metalliresistens TaxID=3031321 RepID=UPI0023DA3C24|nr:hypothetical protein [Salinibacterium metalliresistens]MDF1478775.1 hypothetical protein [Salinibacterium metalliresistens]
MTTKTPTPSKREAASVGAILWITSMDHQVAPESLGGQSAKEQERIMREYMDRDGLAPDRIHFAVGPSAGDSEQRLRIMLAMLDAAPIRHVYVTGAVYANDSEEDRMKHHLVLVMHGTRLTICEDE